MADPIDLGSKYVPSEQQARAAKRRRDASAAEVEQGHRAAGAARKRRRNEAAKVGYSEIMRRARREDQASIGASGTSLGSAFPTGRQYRKNQE